jgi:protein-disulfide isomerase
MNNNPKIAMTTETKVAIGMLLFTLAVLGGGVAIFKGRLSPGAGQIETNISKYIQTDIAFDRLKVNPGGNPKITGTGPGTYTGTSTKPIEVTEFMDYECPACASIGEPLTQQLLATYGSRITITRRVFPVHGQPAITVARMVLASQDVSADAYQRLHARVFATQNEWAVLGTAERVTYFRKLTAELGLNYDSLVKIGDQKYAAQIQKDQESAIELGVKATPSFILNYRTRVTGGVPLEYLAPYLEDSAPATTTGTTTASSAVDVK